MSKATEHHTTFPPASIARRRLLGAIAVAPVVAAIPALPSTLNPDADILAMGRDLTDVLHQINTQEEEIDIDSPMWQQREYLEDAIMASHPKTFAGIAVMLRIVYDYMVGRINTDGSPSDDSEWTVKGLWAVIRIAEGSAAI